MLLLLQRLLLLLLWQLLLRRLLAPQPYWCQLSIFVSKLLQVSAHRLESITTATCYAVPCAFGCKPTLRETAMRTGKHKAS